MGLRISFVLLRLHRQLSVRFPGSSLTRHQACCDTPSARELQQLTRALLADLGVARELIIDAVARVVKIGCVRVSADIADFIGNDNGIEEKGTGEGYQGSGARR